MRGDDVEIPYHIGTEKGKEAVTCEVENDRPGDYFGLGVHLPDHVNRLPGELDIVEWLNALHGAWAAGAPFAEDRVVLYPPLEVFDEKTHVIQEVLDLAVVLEARVRKLPSRSVAFPVKPVDIVVDSHPIGIHRIDVRVVELRNLVLP